ncbi:MAG: ABC transporter transmembrane domain-containing protein [Alphaproteobacteria bacterium]|nr:ABC transporter transmembrane domain-containing protein [Alphaproteobacteria bacterium]
MAREFRTTSSEAAMKGAGWAGVGRLMRLLWPTDMPGLKLRLGAAMVLLAGTAMLNALVPLLFARLVDSVAAPERQWAVAGGVFLAGYVGLYWITRLLNESRWALFAPIDQRLQRNLALRAIEHMHGLSIRFHLARKPGQISRILDNGLRGLREILFDAVFLILPLGSEIVFVTVVMLFAVDWVFAAILAAALTLYGIVLVAGSNRLRVHQRRAVETGSRAHGEAVDSLLNFEAVKLFGNEGHVAAHYDHSLGEVESLTVRSLTFRSLLGMAMMTIIAAAMGIILFLAVGRVRAGAMSVGELVLVNAYLLQLIRPMERLGNLYRSIKQALIDLEQLLHLMDERPEIVDRPDAEPLREGPGELSFEKVSFEYGPGRGALHGVSFTARPGRTLAIVGPTGAGKSTIARLLFRFYDVSRGRIAVDGHDIRRVTQDSLRRALAAVPQDTVLFNDTIGDNIRFGRPGADDAAVEEAARAAELHDFIMALPLAYRTVVGERGLKLSGGEKQRVALARSILRRPRIVVLDEATSSLDSHTEATVQRNLTGAFGETTRIIIAHRLSTVVDADEIIVLDRGRIVERGTHAGLVERDGVYAALWKVQSQASDPAEAQPDLLAGQV